jgi:hypothetical protein
MSSDKGKPGPTPLSGLEFYKKDISRGCWFDKHTDAEAAVTIPLMEAFAHNFRNLCNRMGCSCENHCSKMIEANPPESYFHMVDEDGIPNGCLYVSILYHNLVNERLGKATYSYDDIVPLYRPKEFRPCTDKGEVSDKIVEVQKGTRKGIKIEELAKLYPYLIKEMKNTNSKKFNLLPIG